MAAVSRSRAAIRVFGDLLQPAEVSVLLGVRASRAHAKGESFVSAGHEYFRSTGMWMVEANDREPEDLNSQVRELLAKMTSEMAAWHRLADSFTVDLFCGLSMAESNEGLSLSADVLAMLAERRIEVGLDIYAPPQPEEHPEPAGGH